MARNDGCAWFVIQLLMVALALHVIQKAWCVEESLYSKYNVRHGGGAARVINVNIEEINISERMHNEIETMSEAVVFH